MHADGWDAVKWEQLRGNAGSHDLQLGTDTLKALRSLTSSGLSTPSI
jgi:pantothenate kinase-related protein Tda10